MEEKITDAINQEGLLLEEAVRNLMKEINWGLIAYEYPVSIKGVERAETRIDAVIQHPIQYGELLLGVIECKKANREYKTWVFFPERKTDSKRRLSMRYISHIDSRDVEPVRPKQLVVRFPDLSYEERGLTIADTAREVRLNNSTNKRPASTTRIEDACLQISIGLFGILSEESGSLIKRQATFKAAVILPIVVTTAELLVAEYESPRIDDLDEGEISQDRIKYSPVKWLAYRYPLPDRINIEGEEILTKCLEERTERKKLPIFFVNEKSLGEFLKNIRNIAV